MTDYSAAAAALEVPESLVKRSADARAKADNVAVDELLTSWTGGGAAPKAAAPPPAETSASTAPAAVSPPVESPAVPPPSAPVPTLTAPTPAPVTSGAPPVLVGANQSTFMVMAGSIGILFLAIIIGFVVPSLPQPGNGVRTSTIALSAEARAGRTVYAEQGCESCHTQLIRAVVGDANLGPVTLSDSNQILGYRRVGPDLAAIGARVSSIDSVTGLLSGQGRHPIATGLSEEDLSHLLAYLRESR